jgi:hypothetical protein
MNPETKLNMISMGDFINLFEKEVDDFCTYKAINIDENKLSKMLMLMYDLTRNKFKNLVINDITISIGNLYFEDVKKISPEILIRALQVTSNKKAIIAEESEKENYQTFEWNCEFGRALTIRCIHDPGGHILEQQGDTYMDIVEAVKKGFNYYTGDAVAIDKPDSFKTNINKLN